MRLTAQVRYDATPERVFRMLIDQDFQELKCARTGALSYQVDITHDGDEVTVTSSRELPTDAVPEFVRSFVGATVTVRQEERWRPAGDGDERLGSVSVQIVSAPVRFTGTLRMAPDGAAGVDGQTERTLEVFDGELKASVPLIGGRIEKAAEPAIRSAIVAEERTGRQWLAERPG